MVFAEIIIRKTERNRNQNKHKHAKPRGKKKKNKNKNKKKNHSMDQSVFKSLRSWDQIKYKQTNKQLQEQEVQRVTWFSVKSIPAKKMICPAPMQDVRLTRM